MNMETTRPGPRAGLRALAGGTLWAIGMFYFTSLLPLHAATYDQLKSFEGAPGGAYPYAGVIQGADGKLYGTASSGGSLDGGGFEGVVFKLNPDGTGYSILKGDFDYATTGTGLTGLIQGADGKLYGTASVNGSGGDGTVFKLNTDGTGFSVLMSFDDATTGGHLNSGLIQGTDGVLYGAAQFGGSLGYGTVFKLNTDGTGFAILKDFDATSGRYLYGGLMQAADGMLYGTASEGGTSGVGTVFKLNTDGTGFSVIKNFTGSDGAFPQAALIQGTGGALYGTTQSGGAMSNGTIFKLNTNGTGFSVLKHMQTFPGGGNPQGGRLLQVPDGTIYGTAPYGGISGFFGVGTLFQLQPDGTGFSVLLNFDFTASGSQPLGKLTRGTDGNLYGTTTYGGDFSAGTIYRLLIAPVDLPPIADAGTDFSVNEGQVAVMLDGSGSSDPNGDPLTYAWTQVSGTAVTLSDASAQQPTFTAPAGAGTLSFSLTVTANGQNSADTVNVTVVTVNHPPVAEAGPDQTVAEGTLVTLHGENSFDIDNDVFTYAWTQLSGSPTVSLAGADTANPSFTAPNVGPGVTGILLFKLRVEDGLPQDAPAPGYTFANSEDTVTVVVTHVNNNPTAAAGADQTVDENSAVALDGSASSDPDNDTLDFAWAQISGPAIVLSGATTPTPGFTAPLVNAGGADLGFELTVDDGQGGSDTDIVVIHVQNDGDPPLVSAAQPTITSLWPPSHGLVTVGIIGVSDPGNNLTITITGVTQDEPTHGQGDGDTPIDAIIVGDGTVLLRAERSGKGDGRIYRISFTASNPDGSASGVVTVSVPKNAKDPAIDSGEVFDSTQ